MIPRAMLAELGGSLAGASDRQILSLVGMADRMPDPSTLEPVLERVRPRLSRLRPPRPLKLPRLLLLPTESLLVPPRAWHPGDPTIPRSAVAALLAAGLSRLPREVLAEAGRMATGHTIEDSARVRATGAILWPAAAEALLHAAESDPPAGVADPGMRPEDFAAACRDLAFLLLAAPRLAPLQSSQLPLLDEAGVAQLRAVLQEAAGQGEPTLARAVATLVAHFVARAPVLDLVRDAAQRLGLSERSEALDAALAAGFDRAAGHDLHDVLAAASPPERTRAALDAVRAVEAMTQAQNNLRTDRREHVRERGQAIEAGLRHHVVAALSHDVLEPFAGLAELPLVHDAEVATIETAARSLRAIAQAGRRLAAADAYSRAMREALATVARIGLQLAEREAEGIAHDGLTPVDAVRLAEILAGPDDAWTMLGMLSGRGVPVTH